MELTRKVVHIYNGSVHSAAFKVAVECGSFVLLP